MAFAIYKGEKNVAELAARLFRVRGAASKQAGDALLKANPQLQDLSQVPVGSVIVVPSDAPALEQDETAVPAEMVRASAAQRAQQMLAVLDDRLTEIETRASQVSSTILSMAKSKEVKAAANNPTLDQNLPAITKSAGDRLKDIKSSGSSRTKAITELRKGLAEFLAQ